MMHCQELMQDFNMGQIKEETMHVIKHFESGQHRIMNDVKAERLVNKGNWKYIRDATDDEVKLKQMKRQ